MKNSAGKRIRTWLCIAAAVLGVQYLTLVLSVIISRNGFSFSALGQMMQSRLTEPGDAVRYLDIAQNGYVREGENAINLVFYPLYPLLIRLFSFLTGSLPLAGLIISQISYAAASVLLYEYLMLDREAQDAWFGVLLMALYPFSVFAMGVYTEGLFLFLSIACLYLLRKEKYGAAGIVGFFAALTRAQGVLLLLPAAYSLLLGQLGAEKRKLRASDAGLLLIPAGLCVYLSINAVLHGDPFQFLRFEAGEPWYQTSEWVGRNIALQASLGKEYPGLAWIIYYPQIALYFLALCVLLLGVWQRQPVSLLLYGGAYLGFTYLSGWMISGGRYMLCCVPLYVILSALRRRTAQCGLLFFLALLHFIYSLLFFLGYSIM